MQRRQRLFRRPPITSPAKPTASRWPLYIGVILAIWLCYLLYIKTLSLPFLQEDSTHIRWLSWHNPLEPFFTAKGAPDYRPLGKSIIKVWYLLLDRHDRIWLRFHNISFNILNIALIAVLASWIDRSKRRYWTAGIAAVLFGTFPFAYQAIPWINNFFYPLANLLLLSMTAVYWQARVRRSNKLFSISLLLLFLAPFEIEYGLMGSGLLFTVELVLWLQKRQPYPWLTGPLLGLALNLLFLIRSLTIPKQSYAFGAPSAGRLLLISTYFLQGLIYPISPMANWLVNLTGMGNVLAIWIISLPVLLIIVILLMKKQQIGLLVFSLFWFALLNLPALVFVDFDYVVNSPRLLYPPGVGIVILWGAFLALMAFGEKRSLLRGAATAFFLLIIVTANISFVEVRNKLYKLAEKPVLQLAQYAAENPDDQTLLVVNFPSWISPQERIFAMGNHGVQIIPFYINIQELIYAHTGTDQSAQAVQFANIRQPQPYYYGMLGEQVDYERLKEYLHQSGNVYLTLWGENEVELEPIGGVNAGSSFSEDSTYYFADSIRLSVSEFERTEDDITLKLNWQLTSPVDKDLTVFVHLYGPDGQLIDQADGYPLGGLAPFWIWDVGQNVQDIRYLNWPDNSPPGTYAIGIGLYDPLTGDRVEVHDASGTQLPDDLAQVLTITR